jgi:hypothetical protein
MPAPSSSRHAAYSGAGTQLPSGMIGRSGLPTWTRDSCAGLTYSSGGFLNTTSRTISVTVVAPMPPARETMATAAATG